MRLSEAENRYLEAARSAFSALGGGLLAEDSDLICQYLVLRFLRTLPSGEEPSVTGLERYVNRVFPTVLAFLSVANYPATQQEVPIVVGVLSGLRGKGEQHAG
jgi:hypothetical protein